jgi:CBS domain containing-hemolysin-like protein
MSDDSPAASAPTTADTPEDGTLLQSLRKWLRGRRLRNGEDLRTSIAALIKEHESRGASAEASERALLRRILTLHDLTVADVMVPRADIVAVEERAPFDEVARIFAEEQHSRLPVYRRTLDDVTGMVHIKDVFAFTGNRATFRLSRVLRQVLFSAPSMRVLELLDQMRRTHIHMALVVDEFGGIDGLVTIENLVEEIVGDIEDEHDEDEAPHMVEERRGVVLADARTSIEDFEKLYGRVVPEDSEDDIDTLGGLVSSIAGRVPARGELIKHPSGLEFEIVDADARRVRKLRVRNVPSRPAGGA